MKAATIKAAAVSDRPWIARDETFVASLGLGLVVVLLGLTAALGYWTHWTQRDEAHQARVEQLRGIGDSLAQASEVLLANGETSSLRNLIVHAKQRYNLADCRVALPGGRIVADADPSRITLVNLPAKWTDAAADAPAEAEGAGGLTLSFPLLAPGKGLATLTLSAGIQPPPVFLSDLQMGVGAIGAVGLLAALLLYRKTRARVAPLGAIRGAVLAAGQGEISADALSITRFTGPEVSAWNALVNERAGGFRRSLAEQATHAAGGRRDESAELEQLCDAMPTGLIVADDSARVVYANGAAAVFLRKQKQEVLAGDLLALIEQEPVRQAIRDTISGVSRIRKTIVAEPIPGAPGVEAGTEATVLRFAVRPLGRGGASGGGQRVMVAIDDITQQRVAEEARNSFVAHTAHELRTPLTNIRLYVDTALTDGEQDAPLRGKCLNVINQESRRLELMIGQMLSVAEIDAGSLKLNINDVRLEQLLAELVADYQAQAADKGVTLRAELPPKLPVIQADRQRLALALHNLMGNAFKYTPAGGQVTLRARAEHGRLLIDVADTGFGVDPAEAETIFERFRRSKDPRVAKITGTGLGLALSRQIARQHGGDITVESRLNKGSTFTLTLPITPQAG